MENNLEFEEVDISKNIPSKEEFREISEKSGLDIKKMFNTLGTKYKELKLKEVINEKSENELLELLTSDYMLIKRPMAFNGKKLLLGFKEKEYIENLL